MKQQRLDGLADGIFAIVMTLLAFEIKIPSLVSIPSDQAVFQSLLSESGIFLSFILSFALLFTYWRAHHFLTSIYAKNLTVGLSNYNAFFFLLITLIPFCSRLLGEYSQTHTAIIIYGTNVILIGMTLFFMRRHIEMNPKIENLEMHRDEIISGYVRILFPVFSSIIAIVISFINPFFSIIIFTIAILFNLLPASTNWIHNRLVDAAK